MRFIALTDLLIANSHLIGLKITLFWHLTTWWTVFKKIMDNIFILYHEVLENIVWDPYHDFHYYTEDVTCFMSTETYSVIYVILQLFVIKSILVLRIWAMMGKCTTASIMISVYFSAGMAGLFYLSPTMLYEIIIFITAARYGIRQSGGQFQYGPEPIMRLLFQDTVLYFATVLSSILIMTVVDPHLGLTIMSVTMNCMLLGLRKQAFSDSVVRKTLGRPLEIEDRTSAAHFRAGPQASSSLPVPIPHYETSTNHDVQNTAKAAWRFGTRRGAGRHLLLFNVQ
ncbi:uncharacterized protein EV420DRAFT_1482043 [Desarmillaria tabescens]|uniref:Uncharacterized protein n=1 Tax=Armillaria tabescens TaxID=1929756 RepID=A0AA39N0J5_ARMTA|nr:uncharacterized protein EV420DRAFT_1482043 [Desarmillaria tabescens]KAK0452735.1 hypothetical protein EV420DRAFT_1482043 [Desarmillaria tabescens]